MRFLVCLVIATVLGIFAILTFQPASKSLRETRRVEEAKVAELTRLRVENEALRKELNLLKTDRHYLEKFARDNFNLGGTNELIFRFE